MAERGATRRRVLDTAALLLRRQGFHATGVNQVLAHADAPKGSMYFHFPGGREQLAVEAITRAGDGFADALAAVLDDAATAREALHAAADLLGAGLVSSGYREGCPIATVALDAAADSEPVRAARAAGYRRWQDVISDQLPRYGIPETQTRPLAGTVLACLEGALLLARVEHTPPRSTAPPSTWPTCWNGTPHDHPRAVAAAGAGTLRDPARDRGAAPDTPGLPSHTADGVALPPYAPAERPLTTTWTRMRL